MNSTKQTSKFSRFLKNNAALLLIIFCVLAIATVVLVVALTQQTSDIPDDPVVVNPNPDDGKKPDEPVINPPDVDKPEFIKVYFRSPIDYTQITMEYTDGNELLFVFNKTLNMWKTHNAVDLAAADGTTVSAMYDGTVVDVSESYGMGNIVKIDHGDNVVVTYASLADVQVVKGQEVKQGEKIGTVSTTASYEFSDGAHLHLEVTKDGKTTDPMPYVNGEIFREVEAPAAE